MAGKIRKLTALLGAVCMALSFAGCVNQHPQTESQQPSGTSMDSTETAATVPAERRLIATSPSSMEICDRLGLDLVAVCKTGSDIPQRYQGLPTVGTAMAPDAEQIALLEPTDVIGPNSLEDRIAPKFQAAGIPCTFLDLQSVPGMYDSIAMLGEKYGAEEKAAELIEEYESVMADFHQKIQGREAPRVLVLMGLPGAYIACTPNSYVGSLVELAGGESVVQDDFLNFVSWNTEQLLELDPDVILLTAHGLPDQAMAMFEKEFATNDIWKHFRAVQENRVYRLDYALFNMSCTFEWPQALEDLTEILYEGTYSPFLPSDAGTAE